MTRREVERMAAAVNRTGQESENVQKKGLSISPARISQIIGRAVLGEGATTDAWKKWFKATGWPAELIPEMAESESNRQGDKP